MAFSLHKTSKHSRVYREDLNGIKTGICKTTQNPMHYQSVPGSGVYDTPIDLAEVAVDDGSIDGFTAEEADWHFGIQAAVAAGSESPQGTIRFGGRSGTNVMTLRAISLGHLYFPTRAYTIIGTAFDYTLGAPVWARRDIDIASHPSVTSVNVTMTNQFEWKNLSAPNGGTDRVSAFVFIRGGRLEIHCVLKNVGGGVNAWIKANAPPATDVTQTYTGVLYEIDVSGIPKVVQNGQELSWASDFTDEAGDIYLYDSSDNFIAVIPQGYSGRHVGGYERVAVKRFWEDAGTNYMFVGTRYDLWDDYPGFSWFSTSKVKIITDPDSASVLGSPTAWTGHFYSYVDGSGNYYEGPNFPDSLQPTIVRGASGVIGSYYSNTVYTFGWRFAPDIPFNASLTGLGEYAKINNMTNTAFATTLNSPTSIRLVGDVGSSDQPLFLGDPISNNPGGYRDQPGFTKGPGLFAPQNGGAGWAQSNSHVTTDITTPSAFGLALEPLEAGNIIEEIIGRSGWQPENGLRIKTDMSDVRQRSRPDRVEMSINMYEPFGYSSNPGPVLDIVYTERSSTRKPGVSDTPQNRNRLVSRVGGYGANDASFRAGDHDLPAVDTFNNKNRNRFS